MSLNVWVKNTLYEPILYDIGIIQILLMIS